MKFNAIHGVMLLVTVVLIIAAAIFIRIEEIRLNQEPVVHVYIGYIIVAFIIAATVVFVFSHTPYYDRFIKWCNK